MEHPDDLKLAAFIDGRLSASERDEMLEHLAGCEECRGLVGALAQVQVRPRHSVRLRRRSFSPAWWLVPLAAAAAVVLAVLMLQEGPTRRPLPSVADAETVEVEEEDGGRPVREDVTEPLPIVDDTVVVEAPPAPAETPDLPIPGGRPAFVRLNKEEDVEPDGAVAAVDQPEAETDAYASLKVVAVKGFVYYRRKDGDRAFKAVPGTGLSTGDSLDAGMGTALLATRDGVEVYCNRRTVLEATGKAAEIIMREGEAFCRGGGFTVRTPEGEVQDISTSFLVSVKGGVTRVSVTEGKVLCRNEAGKATVSEGYCTTMRKEAAPSEPRPDTSGAGAQAWIQELMPPLLVLDDDALSGGIPWVADRKAVFAVRPLSDDRPAIVWNGEPDQYGAVYFGEATWRDYRVTVMAKWEDGVTSVRVGTFSQSEPAEHGKGYRFDYMAQEKALKAAKNFGEGLIDIAVKPLVLEAGVWHRFEVLSVNGYHSCAVDGKEILSIRDASFTSGMVELGSRGPCTFRSLKVERLAPARR